METAKAILNNYRQSPRKVRLVANFMRGKNAEVALASLDYVDKRASETLKKLLQSALSNAKNSDIPTDKLFIREIMVNSGETLYRRMPAPRGRAMMIRKKTSRITLILGDKLGKGKASKEGIITEKSLPLPVEEKKNTKPKAAAKKAAKKKEIK
jgi:large subunit ribosomal protein L22